MKINILLPHKEKFDEKKTSSVSITVKNNLFYTNFLKDIKIYGQYVENPLFNDNFVGAKYSILSLKSKTRFLTDIMLKTISNSDDKKQIIEIHNRPNLVDYIAKASCFPISLFLHNDPLNMKGSKSIDQRTNLLEKCSAVFCVSKFVKKQFLNGVLVGSHKVHVLYNGVESQRKDFPKKKKEVLFVGRLVYEKGAKLYADVVKSIATDFPDWNFGLLGSSDEMYNKNKNAYAYQVVEKFISIGSQAKVYGFKNHDFVRERMQNGSIIVIPSLCEEAFGLVAAEAMSNGMAIIASKVGGIPEIVEDNGILISNINYLKLKRSLVDIMNDKEKRELLQKKAWLNFTHSSEKSSKYLDCFRETIFQRHF